MWHIRLLLNVKHCYNIWLGNAEWQVVIIAVPIFCDNGEPSKISFSGFVDCQHIDIPPMVSQGKDRIEFSRTWSFSLIEI